MAHERADIPNVRGESPSKIELSDHAQHAGPLDDDGPKTTRRATASRRIPKQVEPELDPAQLAIYSQQQRAALAAAQLAGHEEVVETAPSKRSVVLIAVVAGIALGAGGVFAYYRHVHGQQRSDDATETPKVVASSETTTTEGAVPSTTQSAPDRPPMPAWISGKVTLQPADALVTVDGQPIASEGVIELRGEEGHSFKVELRMGLKRMSFDVILTDHGALPDALSLDAPVAPAPAPPPVVTSVPKPTTGVVPKPFPKQPPPDDDIYE